MNNLRKSKSAFSTLFSRGGLICLLFLLPWFSQLKAQTPGPGVIGIGTQNAATLYILDDDNLNDDANSKARRKIVLIKVQDGDENGLVPAKFMVAFRNGAEYIPATRMYNSGVRSFDLSGGSEPTTAVKDVEVTFTLTPALTNGATGGTSCTAGVDYTYPSSFTVTIPAGANASNIISLPVCPDNIVEGTETIVVTLTNAVTPSGQEIRTGDAVTPSNPGAVTTFDLDSPLTLDILDKSCTSCNVITLATTSTTLTRGGAVATISASLPAGVTYPTDIVITLTPSGAVVGTDYSSTPALATITIPRNTNSSTANIDVQALCAVEDLSKTLNISGAATGFTVTPAPLAITISPLGIGSSITVAGGVNSVCNDASLLLTAPAAPVGSTYEWTEGVSATVLGTASTYTIPAGTTAGSYTYKVKVTTPTGCTRTVSTAITVNPAVNATTISTPVLSLCGDGSIVITATNVANATGYQLFNGSTSASGVVAAVGTNPVTFTVTTSGNYTVVTSNASGCTKTSNALNLSFGSGSTPATPQINSNSTNLCTGGSNILTAVMPVTGVTYPTGTTYSWFKGASSTPIYTSSTSNVYVPTTNGTYTVMVEVAGCSSSASTGVTINNGGGTAPTPAPAIAATSSTTVCSGGSVTLTVTNAAAYAAGTTFDWYCDELNGKLFTGVTYTANPSAAGVYHYWAVAVNSGCTSLISNPKVIVTVISTTSTVAQPIVNVTNSSPACANGSATLEVSNVVAGITYKWYSLTRTGVISTATSYTTNVSDTYWVVASDGTCSSQDSEHKPVVISTGATASPAKPAITKVDSNPACASGSSTLSITSPVAGVTYKWYRKGAAGVISTAAVVTTTTSDKYWVVAVNSTGCASIASDTATVSIVNGGGAIPATPVISQVNSNPACANGSSTLSISNSEAGATYKWYRKGATGVISTAAVLTTTTSDKYWVVAVNGSGCSSSASDTATVSIVNGGGAIPAKPSVTKVDSNPACASGSSTLSITSPEAGVTYKWYRKGAAGVISTAAVLTTTTSDKYWVVAVNGSGCSSSASDTTTVSIINGGGAIPATPVISQVNSNPSCANGSSTLSISNSDASATYKWYRKGAAGVISTAAVLTTTTSDKYWVVAVNGSGCSSSASDTATVSIVNGGGTIPAKPSVTKVDSNPACASGSSTLSITTPESGATYKWYRKGAAGVISTAAVLTTTTSDKYWVVAVNGSGCSSPASDTTTVTIVNGTGTIPAKPIVSTTISGSACATGSAHLQVTNSAEGVSYRWYGKLQTGVLSTAASYTATVSDKYWVVAVNGSGCSSAASDTANVNISTGGTGTNPVKPIVQVATSSNLCTSGSATLTISNPEAGVSYEWFAKTRSGIISTAATYNTTVSDKYWVEAVNVSGCRSLASDTATVNVPTGGAGTNPAKPTVSTVVNGGSSCGAGSATLAVTNVTAGTTYQWFSKEVTGVLSTATTYTTTRSDKYWVVAISASGCTSPISDTATVSVPTAGTGSNPAKPTVSTVVNGGGSCGAGSATLTVTNVEAGVSYRWYGKTQSGVLSTATTYTTTTSDKYWVVAVSASGCASPTSDTATVSVPTAGTGSNPAKPTVSTVVNGGSSCGAGSATLTVTNVEAGVSYRWYGKTQSGVLSTATTYTTTTSDKYWVVAVSASGCASPTSDTATVSVPTAGTGSNPAKPTVSTVVNGGGSCGAGSATLTVTNVEAGVSYRWYGKTQSGVLSTATTYTTTTSDKYWVVAVSASGCASPTSDTATVSVPTAGTGSNPAKPTVSTEVNGGGSCGAGSATLTVTNVEAGVSYRWYGKTQSGVLSTATTYTTTTSDKYWVVAVSASGCASPTSDTATVSVPTAGTGSNPAKPTVSTVVNGGGSCGAGSATLTVTNVEAGVSYRWYGKTQSGVLSTATTYTTTTSDKYWVVAVSASGCASPTSDTATVSVPTAGTGSNPAKPTVSTVVNGGGSCGAGSATLTVTNVEVGVSYHWYGKTQSGVLSTATTYTTTTSDKYWVIAVSASGCASPASDTATVSVPTAGTGTNPVKPIVLVTTSGAGCANGNATLTVTNSETGVSYRWYAKTRAGVLSTASSYNTLVSDKYWVVAVSASGCASPASDTAIVNVPTGGTGVAPLKPIVNVAYHGSACATGSATLTITNPEEGVSYEWHSKTQPTVLSTASSFNTTVSDKYWVIAVTTNGGPTGTCSSPMSDTATVNVPTGGTGTNPTSPTVSVSYSGTACEGGNATLMVTSSVGGLTYQWYRKSQTGVLSTATTYTTTVSDKYWVIAVDNATGCTSTVGAADTVNVTVPAGGGAGTNPAKPTVTVSTSGAACASGTATLTITNVAEGISYRWYGKTQSGVLSTATTYTTTVSDKYWVIAVDNATGCTSTVGAADTVNVTVPAGGGAGTNPAKPIVAVHASGATCVNGSTTLSISNPAVNVTYHWYGKTQQGILSTATSYNTTISDKYWVVAVDNSTGCQSIITATDTVTVTIVNGGGTPVTKPTFTISPASSQVCVGGSATIAVSNPEAGVTYEWYRKTKHGILSTAISFTATESDNYWVVARRGTCTSPASDTARIAISGNVTSMVKPQVHVSNGGQLCVNGSATLSVANMDDYPTGVTYEWYAKAQQGIRGTNATLNVEAADKYWVVVRDALCSSVQSDTATVTQSANTNSLGKPVVNIPNSGQLCNGGTILLSVTNVASGVTYEWYANGKSGILGTTSTLLVTDADTYWVVAKDGSCSSQRSLDATVTPSVNTAPSTVPTLTGSSATICIGGSVELNVDRVAADVDDYYWFRDDVYVATTITGTYSATVAGVYTVVEHTISGCNSSVSNPITIGSSTNNAPAKPEITSASTVVCANVGVILTATSTTTGITEYKWYKNGALVATTTVNTYSVGTAGSYTVSAEVTGCTSLMSDPKVITFDGTVSCDQGRIKLEVEKTTMNEGETIWVKAAFADGYYAINNVQVDLTTGGNAILGAACGTTNVDYTLPASITIQGGTTNSTVNLATCLDNLFEGDETIVVTPSYKGVTVDTPKTIILKDMDANEDGTLNLKLTFNPEIVKKGQTSTLTVTAVARDGVTPVTVQVAHPFDLTYVGSTAHSGTHYTAPLAGTILAGTSQVEMTVTTVNDGIMEGALQVAANIVASALHGAPAAAENLTIMSGNLKGGFDVVMAIVPSVIEGQSFILTATVDGGFPATRDVVINLNQSTTSVAVNGVDYTLPASITIPAGETSASLGIATTDNTLFDGNRRMDVVATAVDVTDSVVIATRTVSGMIIDNDKPCVTISADKKGIDDHDRVVTFTVSINNLTATAGSVTLQLSNIGTGYSYTTDMPSAFTFTSDAPTKTFKVTSSLVAPSASRGAFDIKTYVPTYEHIMFTISNINQTVGYDCFELVKVLNSDDFDMDGLPNFIERKDPTCDLDNGDSNNNGIPNEWDPYDPDADDDGDGILNKDEDTNKDGNPYNDFARDANGNKLTCLANFANNDADGDGVTDDVEKWTDREYDDNGGDIRVHPALSFNNDGMGNDYLYIENINKYPDNKVTVIDRQGIIVFEMEHYTNDRSTAFSGVPNKGRKIGKVPLGTYFVIVEYVKEDPTTHSKQKKFYNKYVEVRY